MEHQTIAEKDFTKIINSLNDYYADNLEDFNDNIQAVDIYNSWAHSSGIIIDDDEVVLFLLLYIAKKMRLPSNISKAIHNNCTRYRTQEVYKNER